MNATPTLMPQPEQTIAGALAALREGRTTARAILDSCIGRIEAAEPTVRAWVRLDLDGARRAADAQDAEPQGAGGALRGIPIGIKDIIDVAGMPTACGFRPWAARRSAGDEVVVAELRAAGAIVVGKTVTTTFAWVDPPKTRNPWNAERTPGGSSSGSAAAVAAGMVLGAIGSQTGGSIIRPASFCGVVGYKPPHGWRRVAPGAFGLDAEAGSRDMLPFAPTLDHYGFFARTVEDIGILRRVAGFAEAEARIGVPTVHRLRGCFDETVDPGMTAALDRACEAWNRAGALGDDVGDFADFSRIAADHWTIMAVEAAAYHEPLYAEYPDEYPPRIRELVEEGRRIRGADYRRAMEHREAWRWELLDGPRARPRILVAPAAPGPAPGPETTGDPRMNSPWSFLGAPAVTFPIGLSAEGLPLGVQLVGLAVDETTLLDRAGRLQRIVRKGILGSC